MLLGGRLVNETESLVCERGLGKSIAPFAMGMVAMGMAVTAMGMVYTV